MTNVNEKPFPLPFLLNIISVFFLSLSFIFVSLGVKIDRTNFRVSRYFYPYRATI